MNSTNNIMLIAIMLILAVLLIVVCIRIVKALLKRNRGKNHSSASDGIMASKDV